MWRGIVIFPPIGVHKLLNLFFPSLLPYRWSLLAWLGLPLLSVYLTVPVHTQWSLLAWLGLPLLSVYTIVLFQKKGILACLGLPYSQYLAVIFHI